MIPLTSALSMPDILWHTSSGHRVFDGVSARSWFIENPDADWQDQIERPFTDEEEAQLAAIGYRDWYAWSWDHWGTKWNACRAELTEPYSIDHGYTVIRFDTAWTPPLPVFHRMFAMFPQLSFSCSWENEDGPELTHTLEREALVEDSVGEE